MYIPRKHEFAPHQDLVYEISSQCEGLLSTEKPQSSKRQWVQCKGYEMRGSVHASSCVLAGKYGLLLESEMYNINIFPENIFKMPTIIFSI